MGAEDTTKQLAKAAMRKCTPNAERLGNAIKALIDAVMRGDIFKNPSAEGILAWLLCTRDLQELLNRIPDWDYNGVGVAGGNATPDQEYFYDRLASQGAGGIELLNRLRTIQYGPQAAFVGGQTATLSARLGDQTTKVETFKEHTDNQSGAGDPIAFMRTMSIAQAFNTSKQQMEGGNNDNFSTMFNSSVQGPAIIDKMRDLLCTPNSLGRILDEILSIIAGLLPFSLDDLIGLLGGRSWDEFFNQLDSMFSQLASFVEFLNYLVQIDFSRFTFANNYLIKKNLGEYLAALVRGQGRGANCVQRAMMEQFLGSDNLKDAIRKIDIEEQEEEKRTAAAAQEETPSGKEKATKKQAQNIKPKEEFFPPPTDEQINAGLPQPEQRKAGLLVGANPESPDFVFDEEVEKVILPLTTNLEELETRIIQLEERLYQTRILLLGITGGEENNNDGGYFNEDASGGPDSVILQGVVWPTPTPTITPTHTPTPTPSGIVFGEVGFE